MPLRSGVLKLLAGKQERDQKISRLESDIGSYAVLNNNLNGQVMGLAEENNRLRIIAQQKESLEAIIKKQFMNLSIQEAVDHYLVLEDIARNRAKQKLLSLERGYREKIKAH